MVYHAKSNAAKQLEKRQAINQSIARALAAYEAEQQRPDSERRGLRPIAQEYGVSFKTLSRRYHNQPSISDFNATKQKLTKAEEKVLVDYASESADRGLPVNHRSIEEAANEILRSRDGDDFDPIGKNWCQRFLTRHRDELQTHWSKPLDTQRARALNPTNVEHWFNLVEKFVVIRKDGPPIQKKDIYAMDETGNTAGDQGTHRVIGRRGTKTQHKQGGADRENITSIVTICADGTTLAPSIIFKGKNFMKKWGQNNVAHASIAVSPNGWTDGELAINWLRDDFDAKTRAKADGQTRLLILDGHSSHYTPTFLRHARDNNIEVLGYPPHCTHALQGLDVVCFARFKEIWKEEVNHFEAKHQISVDKGSFTEVFGTAFLRTFTTDLVQAAFSATGIYPFDRNVIKPSQMKPSEATSVKGSFPLPQTSPVRVVMSAFRYQMMNTANTSPGAQIIISQHSTTPITPTRARLPSDGDIDPALFTPSKRMRLLTSSLATTTSGSFLVSKDPVTSANRIAKPVLERPPDISAPDWSLLKPSVSPTEMPRAALEEYVSDLRTSFHSAKQHIDSRDLIIEGAHAQLVVQDMLSMKQSQTLFARENKKKTDRTMLFPEGKGRHLTDEAFMDALEHLEVQKRTKEAVQESRKVGREARRLEKVALDAEWKRLLEKHSEDLERWSALRQEMEGKNVPKKDWPRKPARPLKPRGQNATIPVASSSAVALDETIAMEGLHPPVYVEGSDESDGDQ